MAWVTAGILNNPAANTILADTGALASAGSATIQVILGADIAAVATLEHRNAANSANINAQVIATGANQAFIAEFPNLSWAVNERFRVRLNNAIVGNAQASIFTF
jgi:hypothetical protein